MTSVTGAEDYNTPNMAENSGAEKRFPPLREIVRNRRAFMWSWIRLRGIVRSRRALWWAGGAIALMALLFVVLWKVPKWQVARVNGLDSMQRFDRENEARKTLATILGGLVVLAGGFATWRNLQLAQETLRVSQEGQITDRFTKAIEQLGAVEASGKKKREVRLGGIYALERIANQSERDYWPIVEVLSTYVRENAPLKPQESPPKNEAPTTSPTPAADIQAILTILGRRERKYEKENQHLDLTNADIRGANLKDANLSGANLRGANLSGARLVTADLNGAYLIEANLNGATLDGAYLIGANLRGANLRGANLRGANLRGANLIRAGLDEIYLNGADLRGANLRGADLRQANNLTQEQVDAALGNSATQLPENLHMPEKWKK